MQELEKALSEGIWAIVATAAGKYIGQLIAIGNDDGKEFTRSAMTKNYFIEHLTNPIRMKWPMEFSSMMIPAHVDTPMGPQIAINRQINAAPIGRCNNVESLTIVVTPVDLIFFDDMSATDAEWHRNLIRNTLNRLLEMRLAESNIIIPGTPHRQRNND